MLYPFNYGSICSFVRGNGRAFGAFRACVGRFPLPTAHNCRASALRKTVAYCGRQSVAEHNAWGVFAAVKISDARRACGRICQLPPHLHRYGCNYISFSPFRQQPYGCCAFFTLRYCPGVLPKSLLNCLLK